MFGPYEDPPFDLYVDWLEDSLMRAALAALAAACPDTDPDLLDARHYGDGIEFFDPAGCLVYDYAIPTGWYPRGTPLHPW